MFYRLVQIIYSLVHFFTKYHIDNTYHVYKKRNMAIKRQRCLVTSDATRSEDVHHLQSMITGRDVLLSSTVERACSNKHIISHHHHHHHQSNKEEMNVQLYFSNTGTWNEWGSSMSFRSSGRSTKRQRRNAMDLSVVNEAFVQGMIPGLDTKEYKEVTNRLSVLKV